MKTLNKLIACAAILLLTGYQNLSAQSWLLTGNPGTTPTTNFIGTTDNVSLKIRTNNVVRVTVTNKGIVGIGNTSPVFKLDVKNGSINTDSLYRISGVQVLKRDATDNVQLGDGNAKVGIGTASPSLAKLQVQGTVGNTIAMFSQSANSKGLSLVSDDPGIYFNSYWNSGAKAMAASGYPTLISTVQGAGGGLIFGASSTANTTANAAVTIPERMRITGDGNVGIGTTTPFYKLAINSNGLGNALQIDNTEILTDAATGKDLYFEASRPHIGTPGNIILQTISTGIGGPYYPGNVGIGTTTPSHKLSINSNGLGNALQIDNTEILTDTTGKNLYFEASRPHLGTPGNIILQTMATGIGGPYYPGNIGIGTLTPTHAKLEMTGSVGAAVAMFGADKHGVTIQADNPEIGFNYFYNGATKTIKAGYGSVIGMLPGNGDVYIGNFNGNQSSTDFGTITGYQQAMIVKQDGRVAIGTSTPATGYQLSVNGKVICEEIKVQLHGNWPDYVFEKSHKLMTLEDLANTIEMNKHLPGIPSACEVEENGGVNLGEMQSKIMEKTEENMLYILQLNNTIKELEAKIDELTKNNK